MDHKIDQSLRKSSTLSFFSTLRPERKRGRGARFNRGGGHFPSVTRQLHTDQTFVNRLEHVVQTTLRDEQITSDATLFHADQHIAHLTETGDHAILDTGASIPVIPPKVADDLQLKISNLSYILKRLCLSFYAWESTSERHSAVDPLACFSHFTLQPAPNLRNARHRFRDSPTLGLGCFHDWLAQRFFI